MVEQSSDFQTIGSLLSARGVMTAQLDSAVGELCEVQVSESSRVLGETIGFHEGRTQILPFEACANVRLGSTVVGLGRPLTVPVGAALRGRVIDGLGRPLDDLGPLNCTARAAITAASPPAMQRPRIVQPLVTGVRVVDALLTVGLGQRVALLAGSGVGKSTLLGDFARGSSADVNVVALIGERGREVRPFIDDCLGPEGLRKSVVIVATADQQPLMRVRAAHASVAIANYFREQGMNVLYMLDSITRFAASQREIGLLLGEPPTVRGYTPSVFHTLSALLEQLGTSGAGTISSIISVLVEGDDLDEPISDAVRSIVDGHIVLDRKLAQHGHYPAVSVPESLSRVFSDVTEEGHRVSATKMRDVLATYAEVEDLVRVGAYTKGTSYRIDKAIHLKTAIDDFVRQGVGRRTSFDETRRRLQQIAGQWDG